MMLQNKVAPAPSDMPKQTESNNVTPNGDADMEELPPNRVVNDRERTPDMEVASPSSPVTHSTPYHVVSCNPVVMETTTDDHAGEDKDDESLREIPVNSVKTARSEPADSKSHTNNWTVEDANGPSVATLQPEVVTDSPKTKQSNRSKQRKVSITAADSQLPDSISSMSDSPKRKRSREKKTSVSSMESDAVREEEGEITARKSKKVKKRRDTVTVQSDAEREKLVEHLGTLPPLQTNRKRGKVSLPPLPSIGERRDSEETNC